tara:strand:- start:31907 stop:33754 length:1848 start_codon:yes stop_codon:yes gene_type:complete
MKSTAFKKSYLTLILLVSSLNILSVELDDSKSAILNSLPADQRENVMQKMMAADELEEEIDAAFEEPRTMAERAPKKERTKKEEKEYREKSKNWIFGYEIFTSSPTTFAPATDIPVPDDYVLGPGDEVKIDIYGNKNISVSSFVSRNGTLRIPSMGPVNVVGLTLSDAREVIQKQVSTKSIGSESFVTLGKLRSITVYILGNAYKPGTYTISSLSTITNALFVSGGVDEKGSVRNIQIKRKGKTVHTYDLYDLLLSGDTSNDIRLEQGDTIFIPVLSKTARVKGSFMREALFEVKDSDKIEDLIFYAGGFSLSSDSNPNLELSRISVNDQVRRRIDFKLDNSTIMNSKVVNGDTLVAQSSSLTRGGTVELRGEFVYPGVYTIKSGDTILDLMQRAGGLTEEAYAYGTSFTRLSVAKQQKLSFERSAEFLENAIANALISGNVGNLTTDAFAPISALIARLRELEPPGRQVIEANPLKLKSDPVLNLSLEDQDTITVPKRPYSVTVVGEVLNASTHTYRSGLSVQDYIDSAGGYNDSADADGIFLILPNGESQEVNKKGFLGSLARGGQDLVPGSTIVVPKDPAPFNWLVMAKTITPVLAESATVVATVIALTDDD